MPCFVRFILVVRTSFEYLQKTSESGNIASLQHAYKYKAYPV